MHAACVVGCHEVIADTSPISMGKYRPRRWERPCSPKCPPGVVAALIGVALDQFAVNAVTGGMWAAVGVEDERSGLAGDERSGRGVPGAVGEQDAGVERAVGDPDQVQCGAAQAADSLGLGGQPLVQVGRQAVPIRSFFLSLSFPYFQDSVGHTRLLRRRVAEVLTELQNCFAIG